MCRNDTQGSKPAFKEYIRPHFFYYEREFTSIYKKCTGFMACTAMYMKSALLYSTLRNIKVQRRAQKRTFSLTRLWWCGIVTFFWKRVISILKKCMVVVHVRLLVWCCVSNMTSFTSLTFVPLTIYGMRINSILFYTNITSHAHGVHLTPSTYT
jgi:hypothetical protein